MTDDDNGVFDNDERLLDSDVVDDDRDNGASLCDNDVMRLMTVVVMVALVAVMVVDGRTRENNDGANGKVC